ncbi:MAG: GMC family oxidoreductase [Planctomycetes bacterium]|nr:GMC family oxidoreductase [Planctomycetota bacterium]
MTSPRTEHADVCVVGTGAGGGLLAYRLAMAGLRVISLEQGKIIQDDYFTNELAPEQEQNYGVTPGMPWPMKATDAYFYDNYRAHQLYATPEVSSSSPASEPVFLNRQMFAVNGKQNVWGAVALRYSERDFRGREFGDSDFNWPIGYGDLERHYSEVERLIGVCGTRENLDVVPDGEFIPPMPLRPVDKILLRAVQRIRDVKIHAIPARKAIETRPEFENACRGCGVCGYGCRGGSVYKFSKRLLPEILPRRNYRLIEHAKVIRLARDPHSDRIAAVECLDTETRQPFRVEAKAVVLSAGAMETPRILFNSPDESFPAGLANRGGAVGCFLHDNVKIGMGTSLLKLAGTRESYDVGYGDGMLIPRFLFDNQEFRGGFQIQYMHIWPRRPFYVDGLAPYPGWLRRRLAKLLFKSYVGLLFQGKPAVSRANRLAPSDARDAFATPQVDVRYASADNDRAMQRSMIQYGRRILRKCSGLVIMDFVDDKPGNSIHYSGTTRMAADGRDGVVNAHLQSFDHSNLYLCDGGVIPELSEKNPTLTIMALANRLAEHLSQRLGATNLRVISAGDPRALAP